MGSSQDGGGGMTIGLVRRGHSRSGGAEAYVGRFAGAAEAAGHRCVLFGGPEWRGADWPHGELRVVNAAGPAAFARAVESEARGRCDLLFSLERMFSCDCYRAGDGVHRAWLRYRAEGAGWAGRLAARWREARRPHREILEMEAALFGGGARAVIANSKMVASEIAEGFGYPAARLRVIPNGYDPPDPEALEPRGAVRARFGLRPGDCALLFAGSGWERKGLRTLMRALGRMRPSDRPHTLVAGRGHWRSAWGALGARHLGEVRDVASLMEACDLFVLPTLYDPFSNACLEALAHGLPVITTARNGCAELVEPGRTGEVIARPDDDDTLAAALAKWRDPALRGSGSARAREIGARYPVARNLSETLEALRAI